MGCSNERAHHADLQHVVDVDAVGRQRHQLEHLDLEDVGRLDAIGGQRHHGQFAGRLQCRRHRLLQRGLVEIHGMTARHGRAPRPPPAQEARERAAQGDSPIFVASCHENRDSPQESVAPWCAAIYRRFARCHNAMIRTPPKAATNRRTPKVSESGLLLTGPRIMFSPASG